MNSKKMKILQVSAVDSTIKSLLLPLIDKMTDEGFEVTSCCSYGSNTDELILKGYNIKNIEILRNINLIAHIKAILNLIKLIKNEKYDVVHVHTPIAALIGRIAAKFCNVPIIIYTAHGFYFHERMAKIKYKILVLVEKLAGKFLTDYIFTQSEEDRITAINEKIIKQDKISTIGNGVDVNKAFNPKLVEKGNIDKKKQELGIGQNDKVIMFIGRMVAEKGIKDLLLAFTMMNNNYYKLVLVGDNSANERDMETYNYVRNIVNNNKNVIMTGRRYDINELLFLSDVFVLPSYREGMPRSIIEAMAMEVPVIATNIRGCREEVVHGETGYIVEVNSPKELKEKIEDILENKALAIKMGINGRARATKLFDEKIVLEKQIVAINELVRDKK